MRLIKRFNWGYAPYYLLICLTALVHMPFLNASVFSAPKLLVLRIVTLGIAGVWGFRMFVSEKIEYRKSWFNVFLVTWGLVIVSTTVFSNFFWTSVLGIDGRFIGVFTLLGLLLLSFFTFNYFQKGQETRKLLEVSFWVAAIAAVYGILQSQSWFDGMTKEFFKWGVSPTERAFSTFGHSTHFAAYLAMHLPVGLFLLGKSGGKLKSRVIVGIGVMAMIGAILVTGSRGGLGAMVIVLAIMGGRYLIQNWKEKSGRFSKLIFGAIIAIVAVGVLGVVLSNQLSNLQTVQRTKAMFELWQEGKITDRQSWWVSSFDIWKDNPLLGSGLSTYADEYNAYRRLDYQVPGDAQDYIVPHNAHMELLNVLATQGLLGIVAYLGLMGYVFWRGVGFMREKKRKNVDKELVFVLLMGLLAYLLHSVLSFGVVSTLTFVYLFLGLVMGIVEGRSVVKLKGMKIAGVLVALLVVIGGIFSIRAYMADIVKQSAENAEFGEDESLYKSAIRLNPYEYSYYLDFGDLLLQKGQISEDVSFAQQKIRQALKYFEAANAINDSHPVVYNHMAIAYSELSKLAVENEDTQRFGTYYEEAVRNHKIAVEKGPNNPMYLYDLGSFLYRNGDYEEAIPYFEEVSRIRPGFKAVDDRMAKIKALRP